MDAAGMIPSAERHWSSVQPFLRILSCRFFHFHPHIVGYGWIVHALLLVSMTSALASPTRAEPAPPSSTTEASHPGAADSEEDDRRKKSLSSKEQKRLDQELPTLTVEERLAADVPSIPPPGRKRYLQLSGAADTEFVLGAEYDNTKVNNSHSRFTFEMGAPLSRVVAIGARVRFGVRAFHFDGDGQFIDSGRSSGEPFDELFEYSATLGARIRLIDWLDLEVAGRGISRIEEGATFGSGLEGGGSLSFLGRYQDWVVLRLGVGLQSNFEGSSVKVSPVFRLRMRLHERLWAETGGRNGRLEWTMTDRVRIDLFGGIQGGRYRLEDRHDGPGGVGEGTLRLRQADVGLATRIELWKTLRVLFEAGVVLSQSLEFEDEDGDSIDKRETREPAFRGRIALKWQF